MGQSPEALCPGLGLPVFSAGDSIHPLPTPNSKPAFPDIEYIFLVGDTKLNNLTILYMIFNRYKKNVYFLQSYKS